MTPRALAAELLGTFIVVLGTCAALLFAPPPGGTLTVALAAGFSLAAATAALGPISGGHFNPAVTVGMIAAGRCDGDRLVGYIVAQVLGAVAAAWLLQVVIGGHGPLPRGAVPIGLVQTANSYGETRAFSLVAALVVEIAASAILVLVVAGAGARTGTTGAAAAGAAPLAIGAALAALCILAIPVTNGALNPARATGPAVLVGGVALSQLWVFWVAPIGGGLIGGAIARWLLEEEV